MSWHQEIIEAWSEMAFWEYQYEWLSRNYRVAYNATLHESMEARMRETYG